MASLIVHIMLMKVLIVLLNSKFYIYFRLSILIIGLFVEFS